MIPPQERFPWLCVGVFVLAATLFLIFAPDSCKPPNPAVSPCEQFAAVPLRDVPARCHRYFTEPRP